MAAYLKKVHNYSPADIDGYFFDRGSSVEQNSLLGRLFLEERDKRVLRFIGAGILKQT